MDGYTTYKVDNGTLTVDANDVVFSVGNNDENDEEYDTEEESYGDMPLSGYVTKIVCLVSL